VVLARPDLVLQALMYIFEAVPAYPAVAVSDLPDFVKMSSVLLYP
jgi:hypothetical protein